MSRAAGAGSAVLQPNNHNSPMAHSEVLLLKPVEGLGGEGDQVKVRAGYARNYLLLRGIAVPVTAANRKQVESLKRRRGEREAQELNGAQELARKLEKAALAFAVKTGEGGKMFGAVTAADVHDKLAAAGFEIDKKKILLFSPVKTLGRHEVKVKLHADVTVELAFDVVSENPIIEPRAEAPGGERKGEDRNAGERRPDRYAEPKRFAERNPTERKTEPRK